MNAAGAIAAFGAGTLAAGSRISDTARAIGTALDALRPLAQSGKLAGIDLRDGGLPALALTPAQLAADGAVLGLIAGPVELRQAVTVAQAVGTPAAGFAAFGVVDSAANVAAGLAGLQALWRDGVLGAIALTDPAPSGAVPVEISLTAATISGGIDALHRIADRFWLTPSEPGVPMLRLPAREVATATLRDVLWQVTTPVVGIEAAGPVSMATARRIVGASGFDYSTDVLHIVDGLDAIAEGLAAMNWAASMGRIATIELCDAGQAVLAWTPAQLNGAAWAVAKLSPSIRVAQRIGAADAAGAVLDPRFTGFAITDSLAAILANLDGVAALMRGGRVAALRLTDAGTELSLSAADLGRVTGVLGRLDGPPPRYVLSDAGVPGVTLAADVFADPAVRAKVLDRIAGSYTLEVTGALGAGAAAAILAAGGPALSSLGKLRIADHAANIAAHLAPLKALAEAGKLSAIDLLDGGVAGLGLTLATALANGAVLGLITSPYVNGTPGGSSGRLSATSFLALMANLDASAEHGTLAKVTLSNPTTPTMPVSAANLAQYLEAFGKLDNPAVPANPYIVTLTDGGSPVVALSAWQVSAAAVAVLGRVSSAHTVSITGSLGAAAARLLVDGGIAARLSGAVAVVDSGANVAANLAALQSLAGQGRIASISLTDGGRPALVLTPAQVAAAPAALAAIGSGFVLTRNVGAAAAAGEPVGAFAALTVTDSAANVQANLASLQPLALSGRLAGIAVPGGGAVTLSLTAAEVAGNAEALRRIGNPLSIGLLDAGVPTITLRPWQAGAPTIELLGRITTPYALAVDGPVSAASAAALAAGQVPVVGLVIRDAATAFVGRIGEMAALIGAGAVAAIDLGGEAAVLSMTEAEGVTGQAMQALIATPTRLSQIVTVAEIAAATLGAGFSSFTVADTVANVLAGLSQVQALAASGRLGRLRFTDAAPSLVVSTSSITAALETWAAQDGGAWPITLAGADPVLTVPGRILEQAVFRANILGAVTNASWSVVATGRVSAEAAAAMAGEAWAGHLAGGVTVGATARDILAHLPGLAALAEQGRLAAIDMLDAGRVTLLLGADEAVAALSRIMQSFDVLTPGGVLSYKRLDSLAGVRFDGFTEGSGVAIRDLAFAPGGVSFAYAGETLRLLKGGAELARLTVTNGSNFGAGSFYLDDDGAGGTMVKASQAPIAVTDTQLGSSMVTGGDFYAGAVGYLQRQFINPTGHPVNVAAGIPNVFLHGGGVAGGNALAVHSGQNVIDGGIGSNFLVGGVDAAGADTFFLDGRGGGTSWGTVVNFSRGDAVTFWGWKDGITSFDWFASDGAPGFTGATIHARIGGGSGAYDASITFAGVDLATAQGFAFLTSPAGGNSYAYIASF